MKKSHFLSLLLTVLFGPLDLFYSSLPAALFFIVLAIMLGSMLDPILAIFIWPISIIVGVFTVWSHNVKVAIEEKRHNEILAAARSERIEPKL